MRISAADAERLVRRHEGDPGPRGQGISFLDDPMGHGYRLWIPGRLRNPLNNRKMGNGFVWDRYKNKWQNGVDTALLLAGYRRGVVAPDLPKMVTMTALVFNKFDSHDGLRAALKPIPDALKRAGLIDDDRDSAGHEFVYKQQIDRTHPGLMLIVRWKDPEGA